MTTTSPTNPRARLAALRRRGKRHLITLVRERYNVTEADVDTEGYVWLDNPGGAGHWLDDDRLRELVAWLDDRFEHSKDPAAVALGRKVRRETQSRAGSSRSNAKATAARANGQMGGRPKKQPE